MEKTLQHCLKILDFHRGQQRCFPYAIYSLTSFMGFMRLFTFLVNRKSVLAMATPVSDGSTVIPWKYTIDFFSLLNRSGHKCHSNLPLNSPLQQLQCCLILPASLSHCSPCTAALFCMQPVPKAVTCQWCQSQRSTIQELMAAGRVTHTYWMEQ